MPNSSERAKYRSTVWRVEAFAANGQVEWSAGPTPELLKPPRNPKDSCRNIEALNALREIFYPELGENNASDRSKLKILLGFGNC